MNQLLPQTFQLSQVGITNTKDLTDEQLKDGLRVIGEYKDVSQWVEQDLVCELVSRHPEIVEKARRINRQMEFDFMKRLPSFQVAKAIPLDHRQLSLSFEHHREIASECESLEEIDAWLARAAKEGWTLAELRKCLRKRDVDDSKTGKVVSKLSWLEPLTTTTAKICRKQPKEYSDEERGVLRKTLKPLVEFYEKLK